LNDSEDQLTWLEAQAERAYGLMYDVIDPTAAAGHYSDVKEALADAIGMARRLGKPDVAERLEARLAHIKAVFRSQFA
jgi:hypothetical protein